MFLDKIYTIYIIFHTLMTFAWKAGSATVRFASSSPDLCNVYAMAEK